LVDGLDHLVLTVTSIEQTCAFYQAALGLRVMRFGAGRIALGFGLQKFNLHEENREFEPKARRPTPGSADLCLLSSTPVTSIAEHLARLGVALEAGPVERTGAVSKLLSIYFRDPDGNVIEVSNEMHGYAPSALQGQ
jgi:catechol 2,3-dioxygenase-like lactoylglutathione lyase family enzyme